MLISEHTTGTEVCVIAKSVNCSREFKTIIRRMLPDKHLLYKYAVVCDVLMFGSKILNFGGLRCDVKIQGEDGRTYTYPACKISVTKIDGEPYHLIENANDIKPSNLRTAYRFPISSEAAIRPKANFGTFRGYIKDISQTGIAFTVTDNHSYTPRVSDNCHVSFNYGNTKYNIECTIVRVQDAEDNSGRLIVGATLEKYTNQIQQLIGKLQIQEARIRRAAAYKN